MEQQKNEIEEPKKGFDEIVNDKITAFRFLESDHIKLQVFLNCKCQFVY